MPLHERFSEAPGAATWLDDLTIGLSTNQKNEFNDLLEYGGGYLWPSQALECAYWAASRSKPPADITIDQASFSVLCKILLKDLGYLKVKSFAALLARDTSDDISKKAHDSLAKWSADNDGEVDALTEKRYAQLRRQQREASEPAFVIIRTSADAPGTYLISAHLRGQQVWPESNYARSYSAEELPEAFSALHVKLKSARPSWRGSIIDLFAPLDLLQHSFHTWYVADPDDTEDDSAEAEQAQIGFECSVVLRSSERAERKGRLGRGYADWLTCWTDLQLNHHPTQQVKVILTDPSESEQLKTRANISPFHCYAEHCHGPVEERRKWIRDALCSGAPIGLWSHKDVDAQTQQAALPIIEDWLNTTSLLELPKTMFDRKNWNTRRPLVLFYDNPDQMPHECFE